MKLLIFFLLLPIFASLAFPSIFAPSHPEFSGTWNSTRTITIIVNGTPWVPDDFFPENFVNELELRYEDYEDKDLIIDTLIEQLLRASAATVALERLPPEDKNEFLKKTLVHSNCSQILRDVEGVAVNMSDPEHLRILDEYGECASRNTTNEKIDQILKNQEIDEARDYTNLILGIVIAGVITGGVSWFFYHKSKKN